MIRSGDYAVVEPRTVDVHVRRLCEAVIREGERDIIRTVRAAGYVFDAARSLPAVVSPSAGPGRANSYYYSVARKYTQEIARPTVPDMAPHKNRSMHPADSSLFIERLIGAHPTTVRATNTTLRQAGVIAYRIRRRKVQVLLMTSRDTGRWIIPKGNINAGKTPSDAAQAEAFEEAGIKGTIFGSTPLGVYTYPKKLGSGEARDATVEVYLLQVKEQFKKWPERSERKLAWVSAKKAVSLVEEPGVLPLLVKLMEVEALLISTG